MENSSEEDNISVSSGDFSDSSSFHSHSPRSSLPAKSPFLFNDELDLLWERCIQFASSVNGQPIHPTHIALTLLFEDLRQGTDPRLRLRTDQHRGKVLERPLFWIAISKLSSPRRTESLDDHIVETFTHRFEPSKPIQLFFGEALWERIQRLGESELTPPMVDYDIRGVSSRNISAMDNALSNHLDIDGVRLSGHSPRFPEGEGSQRKKCAYSPRVVTMETDVTSQSDKFIAPHHILLAILDPDDTDGDNSVRLILERKTGLLANDVVDIVKRMRQKKVLKHESMERFPILNQ